MTFSYSPIDTLAFLKVSTSPYTKRAGNPKQKLQARWIFRYRWPFSDGSSRTRVPEKNCTEPALIRPSITKPQVALSKHRRQLGPSDIQISRDKSEVGVKKHRSKKCILKGDLRRFAIRNRARQSRKTQAQFKTAEENPQHVAIQEIEREKPDEPRCNDIPSWLPSPVGISDYEAIDREGMTENEQIYSDFNYMVSTQRESGYSFRKDLRTFPWHALRRPDLQQDQIPVGDQGRRERGFD